MPRKVQVDLDLDASRYLREARGVSVTTKAVDEEMHALGHATDAAGRDMEQLSGHAEAAKHQVDGLGEQVGGTSRAMDGLSATARVAGHEVDGFGHQAEQAAVAVTLLDARIKATRASVRELGLEFAATGDANTGKKLNSERGTLGQLSRLRKELMTLADDGAQIGAAIGTNVSKGVKTSLDFGALPGLMPALIGLGVAAAPFIGAAVAGAVVGGVGLGGIAGGIFAASGDPRVKKAWGEFTASLTGDSFGRQAFVQPVIEGIAILKAGLADFHLGDILGKGASAVPKLANALLALAKGILPGLSAALDHADEYAAILGEGFGKVGTAVGQMIVDFANSKGAMEGLRTTFTAVADAINVVNGVVTFASDSFAALNAAVVPIAGTMSVLYGWMPVVGDAFAEGSAKADAMGHSVNSFDGTAQSAIGTLHHITGGTSSFGEASWYAAVKVGDLTKAWDELHGRFATADETLLAAKKGLQDVADTFASGGKQVQGSTVAILENRVALEHQAQLAVAAAEAYLKLTGDAAGAAKILDDQRIAAEKSTGATGNNAKAVHALADELFKLPPVIPVVIDVSTNYTSPTAGQIAKNLKLENRLQGGRAEGGPVWPGLWKVGERGPEILEVGAGQSGYVHSSEQSWRSAPGGGSTGGGYATPAVNLTVNMIDPITGAVTRSMLITDALNRNQPASAVKAAYP